MELHLTEIKEKDENTPTTTNTSEPKRLKTGRVPRLGVLQPKSVQEQVCRFQTESRIYDETLSLRGAESGCVEGAESGRAGISFIRCFSLWPPSADPGAAAPPVKVY